MNAPVFVQATIPQPTIKRFDLRILDRPGRLNEAQRDAPVAGPLRHRLATEFLAVIGANHSDVPPLSVAF